MAHAFTLPDLGEGLAEGEVARWLVAEGDEVAENEPIVEIQTDKATVEIGSPVDGVVLRILAREGELAAVGATLALIGAAGEQLLHSVASPPREQPAPAEPLVAVVGSEPLGALPLHRLARELLVDIASVKGTGPGGRVTEADVRASAAAHRRTPGACTRNPARDRRAGRAHPPGDPCRHVRRGMRLHRCRPRPPRGDDAPGSCSLARRLSGSIPTGSTSPTPTASLAGRCSMCCAAGTRPPSRRGRSGP